MSKIASYFLLLCFRQQSGQKYQKMACRNRAKSLGQRVIVLIHVLKSEIDQFDHSLPYSIPYQSRTLIKDSIKNTFILPQHPATLLFLSRCEIHEKMIEQLVRISTVIFQHHLRSNSYEFLNQEQHPLTGIDLLPTCRAST